MVAMPAVRKRTLREIRLDLFMPQVEIAKAVQVDQGSWSAYERGVTEPSLRVKARVVAYLEERGIRREEIQWPEKGGRSPASQSGHSASG